MNKGVGNFYQKIRRTGQDRTNINEKAEGVNKRTK